MAFGAEADDASGGRRYLLVARRIGAGKLVSFADSKKYFPKRNRRRNRAEEEIPCSHVNDSGWSIPLYKTRFPPHAAGFSIGQLAYLGMHAMSSRTCPWGVRAERKGGTRPAYESTPPSSVEARIFLQLSISNLEVSAP